MCLLGLHYCGQTDIVYSLYFERVHRGCNSYRLAVCVVGKISSYVSFFFHTCILVLQKLVLSEVELGLFRRVRSAVAQLVELKTVNRRVTSSSVTAGRVAVFWS